MTPRRIERWRSEICGLLLHPSRSGVGLYFYPASHNDLAPLLLMPPNNPLDCDLVMANSSLKEGRPSHPLVLPVLMDCDPNFVADETWFARQPYPALWERFDASVVVNVFVRLELPGEWFLGIAEITRGEFCSAHPFVFCHGDAHQMLPQMHPDTRFHALAFTRCSGLSGGPTGECSRTISDQVAELPWPRRPRFIVADTQASENDVSRIEGYELVPDRVLEDSWGWAPVFLYRRI